MNLTVKARMESLIDEVIPDSKIKDDLATILWEGGKDAVIELEDDEWVTIPHNCPLIIMTKAFFKEYYLVPFGTYKVQIAVGGLTDEGYGIWSATHCFALIYYTEEAQPRSIDLYKEMR